MSRAAFVPSEALAHSHAQMSRRAPSAALLQDQAALSHGDVAVAGLAAGAALLLGPMQT